MRISIHSHKNICLLLRTVAHPWLYSPQTLACIFLALYSRGRGDFASSREHVALLPLLLCCLLYLHVLFPHEWREAVKLYLLLANYAIIPEVQRGVYMSLKANAGGKI